ncbi:FkbM family methyltransferase [Natronobiforma cellulositropha]|uniref:FkbM family methyltransferase n=1 Tax=Natronobiforma cellulositropha TaxID=1679076 RepID=UPI0021D5A017|nr:FkbM family methyltransferase [Natronobiforma cellulositropha]
MDRRRLAFARRVRSRALALGHAAYDRLVGYNYEQELLARRADTAGGPIRSYELLTRHRSDAMLAELAACGPRAVVFDLGANVGIYALALASSAHERQVVAVEPSPVALERLRTNVRLNGLESQIRVVPCGVGDARGVATRDGGRPPTRPFYVSSLPELSGFDAASARRFGARVETVLEVPCVRLDDLASQLPPPDFVKVDVEGAAPAVLRGARETLERYRPTLFVEVHEAGLSGDVPGETRAVLDSLAYTVAERAGYWRCEPRKRESPD